MLCLLATAAWSQNVVIDHLVPGRLGLSVLQQVNSFDDVVSLTISSGRWNETDLNLLRNDFPNLQTLDLGGLDCEYFPSENGATLGSKTALKALILPQNLRVVPQGIISGCTSLTDLDIPASVKVINNGAFVNLPLRNVTLHEGLEVISYAAFSNCTNLEKITVPASVSVMSSPFYHCSNLTSVTSLSPAPPILAGNGGLLGYSYRLTNLKLYTPTGSNYGAAEGWSMIDNIIESEAPASNIKVKGTFVPFPFPTNRPDITLGVGTDSLYNSYYTYYQPYAGRMTVTGSGTLNLGRFNHEVNVHMTGHINGHAIVNVNNTNYLNDIFFPSLVTYAPVTANDVSITHRHVYQQRASVWSFTSLPFDTRLSDLTIDGEGCQWKIMKHSGKMRGNARFDDVWIPQTADSTLHAGEGFIVAVGWDNYKGSQMSMTFKAQATNRNEIFKNADVRIPLRDYSADYECDRGWNFVGNPYPCFFATKYFSLDSPFTVYDNGKYKTYSPVDDDYVLKPFEGFFIQKPWGHDELTLYKEGRFLSEESYDKYKQQNQAPRRVPAIERWVCNITVSSEGEEQDRTRLVVNAAASTGYEPSGDAVKFDAIEGMPTQLWLTGNDGTHYAISEQPLDEGRRIALDAYFATEGDYTIAVSGSSLDGLLLTDTETGDIMPLADSYTFYACEGPCNGRFYIFRANGTDSDEPVYQNGTVTIDGVVYELSNKGTARVQDVTKQVETLEIPQTITYEGATYTVYYFYHYTNTVGYKHLILPPTITNIYISRGNPKTLESVTIQSLCPPTSSYYTYSQRDPSDPFTFYVHPAAVNRYKSSLNYRSIPHILPMTTVPQQLWAHYGLIQFDDNNKPTNTPDMVTHLDFITTHHQTNNTYESQYANIEVEGAKELHLGKFEYFLQQRFRKTMTNGYDSNDVPTLINNSPMTATSVSTCYYTNLEELNKWPMLCLPYDLNPGNITGDFQYTVPTVRRYDGARRAANGVTGTSHDTRNTNWKTVLTGETVAAGEGFILNAYIPSGPENNNLYLPAAANGNGFFATTRNITLKDYPSARAEDRGWNLVGNTYPAYYDMSQSNINTPYIIWDAPSNANSRTTYHYYAYTRDDDDFLLKPFQAFFVQYTDAQHEIHLPGNGRYHSYYDFFMRRPTTAQTLNTDGTVARRLFDIEMTGNEQHDRTRVVINDEATVGFEPAHDVIQLPADGASLLCTIDGAHRYSINERPLPQGDIALGLDIAKEGDYTLSIGKTNSSGLLLTDHETSTTLRLDEGCYTFHATAGRHDQRFTLSFSQPTGITLPSSSAPDGVETVYDLQGRRVAGSPQKGIYIKNGKKTVIR